MIKCIVRMEMPKNCVSCQMSQYIDHDHVICPIELKSVYCDDVDGKDERPDYCPIESEFVTCDDCVHAEAAKRGMCLYDSNICVGGERKENNDARR